MGFLAPTTKITNTSGQTSEFGVTNSAYDESIPIVIGAHRVPGNIIWADEIREEKVTDVQTTGGKGGGAKTETTTVTFRYYVHLAAAFCEGPVTGLVRLWADGKIIFDAGGNGRPAQSLDGLNMRVYNGEETQLPDALIESFVGENNTPAYRGLCYIVLEDFPLANFGNRIPALTAEIVTPESFGAETQVVTLTDDFDNIANGGGTYSANTIGTDAFSAGFNDITDELYVRASAPANEGANAIIDLTNNTVRGIRARSIDFVFDATNRVAGVHEPTGNYLTQPNVNVGGNQGDLWMRDPVTGADVTFFPNTRLSRATVLDDDGQPVVFGRLNGNADLSDLGYRLKNMATGATIASIGNPNENVYTSRMAQRGRDAAALGGAADSEGFACFCSTNEIRIVQAIVDAGGASSLSTIATLTPGDVVSGATTWNTNPAYAVDRTSGDIIFQHTIDGTRYVWKWSTDVNAISGAIAAIQWVTEVPFVLTESTQGETSLAGNSWVWNDTDGRIIRIVLATGAIDTVFDGQSIVADAPTVVQNTHWHDPTSKLIGVNTGSVRILEFDFASGGDISPRQTILNICRRAGFVDADLDVVNVPNRRSDLRSLLIDDRTTAADAIGPLLTLLQIEVFESDFTLRFVPRGLFGSVATIPEDDMIQTGDNDGEAYVRAIIKEEDLPRRVEVSYVDYLNDFQAGVQSDERADTTQFSRRIDTFDYNGAAEASLPRQSAQVQLYTSWVERTRLRSRLPQRYLLLDPGDVVTSQLNNGLQVVGRFRKADIGADFSIDFEQVAETTGQYDSAIVGASGDGLLRTDVPNTGDSDVFIFDTPLLLDVDASANGTTVSYWGGSGEPTWNGVVLYRQTGTSTIGQVGKQIAEMAFGVLETAPPDATIDTRFVDETFDITVTRGIDQFSSVTESDVLNGANLLLLRQASGQIELVQFVNAELIDADTIRVSRLLRGRRGTEPFANGFAPGDEVFLLTTTATNIFSSTTDFINAVQNFRGVTVGQLYENANDLSYTDTARDLRPYSPVRIAAADDGASGLDFSWVRRTRIGGETDLAQAGDVPLSEDSEAYEVDILNAAGDTVLRTLPSTVETVNYSAADITTDFGSLPATLNVVVYQMSATVGRGFPGEATLETS